MTIDSHELNKYIGNYFEHKPGDVIIAPITKKRLHLVEKEKSASIDVKQFPGTRTRMHYYGKIVFSAFYISVYKNGKDKNGRCETLGGWLGGARIDEIINVNITHKLTKEAYNIYEKEKRFLITDIGQYLEAFASIAELAEEIERVIKAYFVGIDLYLGCGINKISRENLKDEIIKEFK